MEKRGFGVILEGKATERSGNSGEPRNSVGVEDMTYCGDSLKIHRSYVNGS